MLLSETLRLLTAINHESNMATTNAHVQFLRGEEDVWLSIGSLETNSFLLGVRNRSSFGIQGAGMIQERS